MRTLDLIEYVVARRAPVVANEIAAALAIPMSSLSYLLNTLVERDYLARDGRSYVAGPGLDRLQADERDFTLAERVAPLVRTLRIKLGETASFFIQSGWETEALVTETGEHALRYAVAIGTRQPLHCLAAGKAILSALNEAEFGRYLRETTRTAFTQSTITDSYNLNAEIAAIRRTGLARTREEHTLGIQGTAKAVVTGGDTIGAFAVAVPTVRFDAATELRVAQHLEQVAALLEAS